jgi:hypothetical protein
MRSTIAHERAAVDRPEALRLSRNGKSIAGGTAETRTAALR